MYQSAGVMDLRKKKTQMKVLDNTGLKIESETDVLEIESNSHEIDINQINSKEYEITLKEDIEY